MTDHPTKRLINAPEDIVTEALAGMIAAHPDMLALEGPTGRAVVAVDGPREGKVGIVIGGGSGHEPAFAGYVGRGLADAAAVGNVFASPGPQQIMDAARAVDGGAGVLFLYGNYTGDVMNFDMAAESCAELGALAQLAMTGLTRLAQAPAPLLPEVQARLAQAYPALTVREREICARTLTGQTARAIGEELALGVSTVLTYRQRAYQKLGMSKSNELLAAIMH